MAARPSRPRSWADCKAFYRLMDCDDFAARRDHRAAHRADAGLGAEGQVLLLLNDTTEINYGGESVARRDWGWWAQHRSRVLFLHTALMRDPVTGEE